MGTRKGTLSSREKKTEGVARVNTPQGENARKRKKT